VQLWSPMHPSISLVGTGRESGVYVAALWPRIRIPVDGEETLSCYYCTRTVA